MVLHLLGGQPSALGLVAKDREAPLVAAVRVSREIMGIFSLWLVAAAVRQPQTLVAISQEMLLAALVAAQWAKTA
jgi:hypothetical protein